MNEKTKVSDTPNFDILEEYKRKQEKQRFERIKKAAEEGARLIELTGRDVTRLFATFFYRRVNGVLYRITDTRHVERLDGWPESGAEMPEIMDIEPESVFAPVPRPGYKFVEVPAEDAKK